MVTFLIILFYLFIFLWGSVPFSVIISRIKGIDILKVGSGNAGATNVYRSLGIAYAILVFFLDLLKGFSACYIAFFIFGNTLSVAISGVFVIVGHTFSPFLKFKGGKGAATGLGVLFFIKPEFVIICAILAALLIQITRYVSVATIVNAIVLIIMAFLPVFQLQFNYQVFITIAAVYVIFKHKSNINNLLKGEEIRIRS